MVEKKAKTILDFQKAFPEVPELIVPRHRNFANLETGDL